MDTSRTGIPRRLALVALAAMVALLFALAPRAAEAREYSIDAVNIDLTVNTDGSIGVVQRCVLGYRHARPRLVDE